MGQNSKLMVVHSLTGSVIEMKFGSLVLLREGNKVNEVLKSSLDQQVNDASTRCNKCSHYSCLVVKMHGSFVVFEACHQHVKHSIKLRQPLCVWKLRLCDFGGRKLSLDEVVTVFNQDAFFMCESMLN